jgi:DNA invertase Pin-like site-specific DNA recombinase
VEEYLDNESAKTGNREAFKRLFTDASRRKFDMVLVWALDRFTRGCRARQLPDGDSGMTVA